MERLAYDSKLAKREEILIRLQSLLLVYLRYSSDRIRGDRYQ